MKQILVLVAVAGLAACGGPRIPTGAEVQPQFDAVAAKWESALKDDVDQLNKFYNFAKDQPDGKYGSQASVIWTRYQKDRDSLHKMISKQFDSLPLPSMMPAVKLLDIQNSILKSEHDAYDDAKYNRLLTKEEYDVLMNEMRDRGYRYLATFYAVVGWSPPQQRATVGAFSNPFPTPPITGTADTSPYHQQIDTQPSMYQVPSYQKPIDPCAMTSCTTTAPSSYAPSYVPSSGGFNAGLDAYGNSTR